jgi:hypothetical protein
MEKKMNRKQVMITMMCLLLLVPVAVMASEHGMEMDHSKMDMSGTEHKSMDHGAMDHNKMEMEHGKKEMAGMSHDMSGMMMLGSEEEDGVKAMFHLNDVKKEMDKVGQPFTHHLMVNFVDSKTGQAITDGRVAVKVKNPAGEEAAAQMMMGMEGHFGIDLVLDQSGLYHFKIGTKLADGKKREFHPHHEF